MDRQAICLSHQDIKKLLESWYNTTKDDLTIDYSKKVQFNIINKTPECSDTWEFE